MTEIITKKVLPNWGDPIPKLNIDKLVPHQWMLVVDNSKGSWVLVRDNPKSFTPATYRKLYSPVLPALPDDFSAEQVFDLLCTSNKGDGADRSLRLKKGFIIWEDCGPVYYPWVVSIKPADYKEHIIDIQKYGAIIQYCVENEMRKCTKPQ